MATMPFDIKKTSYPSRQIRGGPAPLASFEDLSDAISESPEEDPLQLRDDDPDDYDSRTYSDGATPSTPRVLAQTPSTPLALDSFSIGTPDSLGHHSTSFGGLNSRPDSPRQENNSRGSSPPRMSPLLGGRHSKVTTPDPTLNLSAADTKQSKKSTAGTPSPRSARKLFTMSFFKPREDKSPSPMISPKSPRRLSPSALSPKSPRKTPFGGIFRSKDSTQEVTGSDHLSVGGFGSGLPSPTKKKGHFAHFLRPKDDKKHDGTVPLDHGGRKEGGGGRYAGVFANLFRRGEAGSSRSTTSPSDKKMSPMAHTPEDEEWSVSRVHATSASQHSTLPSTIVEQEVVEGGDVFDIPPLQSDNRIGVMIDDRRLFESSHDIADAVTDKYDPKLRLGLSPSNDTHSIPTVTPSSDLIRNSKPDMTRVDVSVSSTSVPLTSSNLSLDCSRQEVVPKSSVTCVATVSLDDKMSPESEVDAPEADPALLKTLKKDEPEAETLLREDSFETDDFVVDGTALDETGASRTTPDKELMPRHRDKIACFRMNPVDRPRSTAPISYSSLEAYISIVAHQPSTGQLVAPTMAISTVSCSEGVQAESAKLKVILPGEEFEHKARQGKKPVYKSWIEFCEVGLQSPRSRRRQMVGERASSAPSDSSTRSFHKEAGRSSSVVERRKLTETEFSASSDAWVTFDSSPVGEVRQVKKRQFSSRSLPHPRKSSSSSSRSSSPPPPHLRSLDVVLQNGRDVLSSGGHSSGSSSRSDSPNLMETVNLKTVEDDDEEVEPLVSDNVVDVSDQFGNVHQSQLFFGDSQFVQVQSSLDDWTLTNSEDISFEHPPVVVPDCVPSAHLQNRSTGDQDCEVTDWFNGGIDLLASIPTPLSKQPESPAIESSSSIPRTPPRRPNPLPPPPPLPQRQGSARRLPPPPPPPTQANTTTTSVRGQHM